MNLTKFMTKVDAIAQKYEREKLLQVIHEVARTLPEKSRDQFIQLIECVGQESKKMEKSNSIKSDYRICEDILYKLEEGEKVLCEEYNEEYDDWYNSSVDELLYEDPEDIAGDLEKICAFIHRCVDVEAYSYALEIGRRLLNLRIQTDGEYSGADLDLQEMIHYELLRKNLKPVVLDIMYACYMQEDRKKVPETLYEIFFNAKIPELRLEDLMQYADEELTNFQSFLESWIEYLGLRKGHLAERLYTEALELTNDTETKISNAQKYVQIHPGLYKKILEDVSIDAKQAVKIGVDGMTRINRKLLIRSSVALKTAEHAIATHAEQSFLENCYVQAFESETNAVNYLRAFLNSVDRDACKIKLRRILEWQIKESAGKKYFYGYGESRLSELAENKPERNMLYILQLLDGEFMEVMRSGVSEREALGWSSTFMKQGLAFYLLYLSDGNNLGKGTADMTEITRKAFSFDIATYIQGQNMHVTQNENTFFRDVFMQWKSETNLKETDRNKILLHIEKWMEKRVTGIMEANRRNYYGECASYIAAIGEVREYLGEKGGKQIYMSGYAAKYPRRSAFKSELQYYGWIKRK